MKLFKTPGNFLQIFSKKNELEKKENGQELITLRKTRNQLYQKNIQLKNHLVVKENQVIALREEVIGRLIKRKNLLITLEEMNHPSNLAIENHIQALFTYTSSNFPQIKLATSERGIKKNIKTLQKEQDDLIERIANIDLDECLQTFLQAEEKINLEIQQLSQTIFVEESNIALDEVQKDIKHYKENFHKPNFDSKSIIEDPKLSSPSVPAVRKQARLSVYADSIMQQARERIDQYNKLVRYQKTKEKLTWVATILGDAHILKESMENQQKKESRTALTELKSSINLFRELADEKRATCCSSLWTSQRGQTDNEKIFLHLVDKWILFLDAGIYPSAEPLHVHENKSQDFSRENIDESFSLRRSENSRLIPAAENSSSSTFIPQL